MRSHLCPSCGNLLYFTNDTCLQCGSAVGLRPSTGQMDLVRDGDLRCGVHDMLGCNWLVEDGEAQCRSCRLTRTWAPLDDDAAREQVVETEQAKRRLVWQLLALGLPVERLSFDLESSEFGDVVISHDEGLITVDVTEADAAHREEVREQMGEVYRTMLGHFRHESGHGLFPALVLESDHADQARALFGDERADYQDALDRHYEQGPPAGWQDDHVSAYATMHPSEDWAETFAHYLHIRDTLETAGAYGLQPMLPTRVAPTSPEVGPFAELLDAWLPLTVALNAVNRSMGLDDVYPFVLAPRVIDKLALVHDLVTGG